MVQNTMGNLITIEGDKAKEIIKSLLIPVPDSNEILFDFNKIAAVDSETDEQECTLKWGIKRNASDCSIIFDDEKCEELTPANRIFFNTHDCCDKVIRSLSEKFPELTVKHEWSDDIAETSGFAVYKSGYLIKGCDYAPLSLESVSTFYLLFGRYDDIIWDGETEKYVRAETVM